MYIPGHPPTSPGSSSSAVDRPVGPHTCCGADCVAVAESQWRNGPRHARPAALPSCCIRQPCSPRSSRLRVTLRGCWALLASLQRAKPRRARLARASGAQQPRKARLARAGLLGFTPVREALGAHGRRRRRRRRLRRRRQRRRPTGGRAIRGPTGCHKALPRRLSRCCSPAVCPGPLRLAAAVAPRPPVETQARDVQSGTSCERPATAPPAVWACHSEHRSSRAVAAGRGAGPQPDLSAAASWGSRPPRRASLRPCWAGGPVLPPRPLRAGSQRRRPRRSC